MEKAGVYIDGANIFHGGRDSGWLLDYAKLVKFVKRKFDPAILGYYNCTGYLLSSRGKRQKDSNGNYLLNPSQVNFHLKLEGMGYRVTTKPLKYVLGNPNSPKNKLDGEIILDAFKESHIWQSLLLFTGDSDFEPLVREISSQGKNVHIFSYRSNTSYELKKIAITSPLVTYTKLDDLRSLLERTSS
jgi:uncharacterized LabA/DUF88 family protein